MPATQVTDRYAVGMVTCNIKKMIVVFVNCYFVHWEWEVTHQMNEHILAEWEQVLQISTNKQCYLDSKAVPLYFLSSWWIQSQ